MQSLTPVEFSSQKLDEMFNKFKFQAVFEIERATDTYESFKTSEATLDVLYRYKKRPSRDRIMGWLTAEDLVRFDQMILIFHYLQQAKWFEVQGIQHPGCIEIAYATSMILNAESFDDFLKYFTPFLLRIKDYISTEVDGATN
jgi:hypothetical protein